MRRFQFILLDALHTCLNLPLQYSGYAIDSKQTLVLLSVLESKRLLAEGVRISCVWYCDS